MKRSMKARIVYKTLTTLAALVAAVYTYSSMPEGRALTETERMATGRIPTPKRTDCSICVDNGDSLQCHGDAWPPNE